MSTLLHQACTLGKKTSVKRIIESVALHELEFKDEFGRTPLMLCVMHNHFDCAAFLLKAGVHTNNSDDSGLTAFHIAASKGFHRCLKLLLSFNASCQQKDFHGVSPLHLAAITSNPKCFTVMLKEMLPGEIDIADSSKKTALHWSAAFSNPDATNILLVNDASTYIPDEGGKTPLHWAVITEKAESLDCVKLMLEKEKNLINWQDYEGRSALHLSVATGSADVVRYLVCREDCTIDVLDNSFCTPLHWAARRGFYEKVDILLNAGACFTSADDNGASPLHYAAFYNHAKTVEYFLSRKYVKDIEDKNGRNSFIWAAARNAMDVISTFKDVDCLCCDMNGITALHAAAIQGHVAAIELLLSLKFPVNIKDKYGLTPLLRACEFGRSKAVKILIEHGADVHLQDVNQRSCLHWCAIGGHAYLCQDFLQRDLSCNAQDIFGMTPLHYACMTSGHLNCVSILLESGAHANITDVEGKTPLHRAVLGHFHNAVKLLCEYDADVNAMISQSGWVTPLDLAISKDNAGVISLLREYGSLRLKEIENIAASKIQNWYIKSPQTRVREKSKKFDEHSESKTVSDEMRHDVESYKNTCQEEKKVQNFPIPRFQMQHKSSRKFSLKSCGGGDIPMLRIVSATIIQRSWRGYLMKTKFKKMHIKIQKTFKSDKAKKLSERWMHEHLETFYSQW